MKSSKGTHRKDLYSTLLNFPTGSKFSGTYNAMGMQDYGMYVWPNGSRYVGLFHNNKFHGDGYIELQPPHKTCYKVHHEDGKLTKIYNISFTDYLQVDFEFTGDSIGFENWDYCSSKDRQFCAEKMGEMAAVGPLKFKTCEGPDPPPLAPNIFDLGFGKFNRFGYVTQMSRHWSPTTQCYVDCPEARAWIKNNCRHGKLEQDLDAEALAQFTREIIESNVESDRNVVGKPHRELISSPRLKEGHSNSDSSLAKQTLLCANSTSSFTSVFDKTTIRTKLLDSDHCVYRKIKEQQKSKLHQHKMKPSAADTLVNILPA